MRKSSYYLSRLPSKNPMPAIWEARTTYWGK